MLRRIEFPEEWNTLKRKYLHNSKFQNIRYLSKLGFGMIITYFNQSYGIPLIQDNFLVHIANWKNDISTSTISHEMLPWARNLWFSWRWLCVFETVNWRNRVYIYLTQKMVLNNGIILVELAIWICVSFTFEYVFWGFYMCFAI